jgi:hypothetical protein
MRRAISYVNSGKFRVKTEAEQQIWNESSRLIPTRLQADQRCLHVRGVASNCFCVKLLPHKHLARCAERYKVKGCLAKVDAN